ncbi:hypothetical protein VC_0536 [Vibrio cholerae O1 biovar El Tor str. N16961]|uniref:Uncharacterized protein n=2 Tax=Vibrio cholerae TaxID=666 RepID=Q9KUI5_VIBCH|nr:hypothetical protein VC_0536 [Vibrio cholerae O1 biovar El Tor str. N16961]ACP04819.1 conserved hypothetical protein [Vibrio cholerae M66-2]ACP08572.1 conserved hypothetical protein [Vibrio cholerae O395]EEO09322.1 hypothetical protein VCC_003690 [Vibrio cholerae RC9]EEO20812.1 hypothetical protein VCF_002369 [Vibrio cholerae BX 330286]
MSLLIIICAGLAAFHHKAGMGHLKTVTENSKPD